MSILDKYHICVSCAENAPQSLCQPSNSLEILNVQSALTSPQTQPKPFTAATQVKSDFRRSGASTLTMLSGHASDEMSAIVLGASYSTNIRGILQLPLAN